MDINTIVNPVNNFLANELGIAWDFWTCLILLAIFLAISEVCYVGLIFLCKKDFQKNKDWIGNAVSAKFASWFLAAGLIAMAKYPKVLAEVVGLIIGCAILVGYVCLNLWLANKLVRKKK